MARRVREGAADRHLTCAKNAGQVAECKRPAGKFAMGASCSADAQCSSLWCEREETDACGKCAAQKIGDCGKGCGVGRSCALGSCVTPAQTGGSCTGSGACFGFLSCTDGNCGPPAMAGEKCDPAGKGAPTCDFAAGLICDPAAKICSQAKVEVQSGQTCGDLKVCGGALKCGAAKQCLWPVPDGGECEVGKGQFCDPPARCVDERCKLPDPAPCK